MPRVVTGLACAALLAICAGPAYGQDGGAIVDPDSPSGKEYEIPFESARRQADPRPASPESIASQTTQATLFGEGVTSSNSGRAGKDGGSPSVKGSDGRGANSGTDRRPDVVKIAASRPGAPDSGVGTPMLVLGIGFLVLLVGAGAGIVVRRRTDSLDD